MMTTSDRTAADVMAAGRTLLGRKWAHQGRGEKLDCIGVVIAIARALRLPYNDPAPYSRFPRLADGSRLERELSAQLVLVPEGAPEPGMVGLFWVSARSKVPQHIAVFTDMDGAGLLHAVVRGRVVEQPFDSHWEDRLIRLYRFPRVRY